MKWEKEINENVRSGIAELLILHLLSETDMYGYEIRKALASRTHNAFEMKEASLYGPLYRMSSRGLISSYKKLVGEKRFRVYYHIEDSGKQYLNYGAEQIRYVFSGVLDMINSNETIQGQDNAEQEE